jgi:sRNA-binding protein
MQRVSVTMARAASPKAGHAPAVLGNKALIRLFRKLWPAVFGRPPLNPLAGRSPLKPLAIGIHRDIGEALPVLEPERIAAALRHHCRQTPYLVALSRGGPRYGLDGQPRGEVTAEEARSAGLRAWDRLKLTEREREAIAGTSEKHDYRTLTGCETEDHTCPN